MPMPADHPGALDLGDGHSLWFIGWHPDRALNPQYDDRPDIPKAMFVLRHPEAGPPPPGYASRGEGWCESGGALDVPGARELFPGRPMWQVESWEPLTLAPSILCRACGAHGFIREGRWLPA